MTEVDNRVQPGWEEEGEGKTEPEIEDKRAFSFEANILNVKCKKKTEVTPIIRFHFSSHEFCEVMLINHIQQV